MGKCLLTTATPCKCLWHRGPVLVMSCVLSLLNAACSLIYREEIERTQCSDQTDCAQASTALGVPLVCRAEACQMALCNRNEDCPHNSTCVSNTCVGTSAGADTTVPCALDAECGLGNRCGFEGFCYSTWGCLEVDRDPTSASRTLQYSMLVRNIEAPDDPSRVGDIMVSACSVIDPTCAVPNVGPMDFSISSDKLLTTTFHNVPLTGFIGAMRVDVQPEVQGILPSYIHFTADAPLYDSFYSQTPLLVIRAELFSLLAVGAAVTIDPNATTIAVRVHDCGGRTVAGVSMAALDAANAQFVPLQADRVPVVGGTQTTETGGALLVNVPANRPVPLTFTDVDSGRILTDSALLNPRPAAINYLFWYPRRSAQLKWMGEARKRGLVQ